MSNFSSFPFGSGGPPDKDAANPSEPLLRQLLAQTEECYLVLTTDGQIRWMNESARSQLQSRGIANPGSWVELWSAQQESAARTALAAASQGRSQFKGLQSTATGDENTWECRLSHVPSDTAPLPLVMCVARNVTTQNKAASSLQESESRHRFVIEHAVDGIFQNALDHTTTAMNPALAAMLGYTNAYVALADWPGFLLESFVDAGRRTELQSLLGKQDVVRGFEYQLQRRGGSRLWCSLTLRARRDRPGRLLGYAGYIRDISQYKMAEKLVREQADFINRSHHSIMVTDLHGRFTFWNKGSERVFGYRAEEILGQKEDLIAGSNASHLREIAATVHTRGEWRGELSLVAKSGQPVIAEVHFSLIRDEKGTPTARLGIASDVTIKKQLEERSFHAQRMDNLGLLAAGIAHDLNNTLTPILLSTQMLFDHVADDQGRQMLELVQASARRGSDLVKEILKQSSQAAGEIRRLEITGTIEDLARLIRHTFPKSITYHQSIDAGLWSIQGNAIHLHQVLLNLCVNARDAMPEGGQLQVKAANRHLDAVAASTIKGARPGTYVLLEVKDTGVGIPPEIGDRIWDSFYTTKDKERGTGLGLTTVRGIVEQHRGFVTLDSEVGAGTTFGIWLPADTTGSPPEVVPQPAGVTRGKGELIMVVDDEPNIRDLAYSVLTRKGYEVILAADGTEALQQFRKSERPVDLVITDLQMPNQDGRTLITQLHELEPSIKILVISGSKTDHLPDRPNLAILPKPFAMDRMLTNVYDLLAG